MEIKEFVKYLGYDPEEVKDLDSLKGKFDSDFVRKAAIKDDKELIGSIIGSRMGSITTTINRAAKELGVELGDDLKDKKVEEVISYVFDTVKTTHSNKVKELEDSLKQSGDEAVKTWQEKYVKLESKFKDTKDLLGNLQGELEKTKTEASQKIKTFKINSVVDSAYKKIPFKSDMTELERKGFDAIIGSKYQVDLDDEENPFVVDRASGKRIPNPNKAGTFLTVEDIFDLEADKAGLKKKNNAGGTPPIKHPLERQNGNNSGGGRHDEPRNKRRTTYDQR